MDREDIKLNQLFAAAKEQPAEVTFDETKKRFLKSLALAAGGVLATKGIIHLLTKKSIIMISLISTVTVTTAVVVSTVYYNSTTGGNNQSNLPSNTTQYVDLSTKTEEDKEDPKSLVENSVTQADKEDYKGVSTEYTGKNGPVLDEDNSAPVIATTEHPVDTNFVDEQQEERAVAFTITAKTTEDELKKIEAAAKEAGIELIYDFQMKNRNLTYVSITMKLENKEGKQKIVTTTDFEENDKMEINWVRDEHGKAISIGTGEVKRNHSEKPEVEAPETPETPEAPKTPEEIEEHPESLRAFVLEIKRDLKEVGKDLKNIDEVELPRLKKLKEKLKELDTLSQPVKAEIGEQIDKIEDELKRIREKLKEMDDEEKQEARKKELEEIEEDLKEAIEDLKEELEEMEEKLKEEEKENQKEKEKENGK